MKTDVMVKFKKAMSMVTLLLAFVALVIASIGASFSFAWFSETSTAQIQEVNFNSQSVTNIGFQGESGDVTHGSYKGQHAFYKFQDDNQQNDFKLIFDGETNLLIREDRAYECSIPIKVTASDENVSVKITSCKLIPPTQNGNGETVDPTIIHKDNLPYCFTWYMVPHKDSANIYTPKGPATQEFAIVTQGKDEIEAGESYYRKENNKFYKILENESFPAQIYKRAKITLGQNNDIRLNGNDMEMDFILVFCPEELYWGQYASPEKITFKAAYPNNYDEAVKRACYNPTDLSAQNNGDEQLYYSKNKFKGSSFLFNVTMSAIKR